MTSVKNPVSRRHNGNSFPSVQREPSRRRNPSRESKAGSFGQTGKRMLIWNWTIRSGGIAVEVLVVIVFLLKRGTGRNGHRHLMKVFDEQASVK